LVPVVREFAPEAPVIVPPPAFRTLPARLAWEHLVFPSGVTRAGVPDVVLSPFNVAPARWPSTKTRLAVIVSNLAPYAPAILRLYPRGRERLRLEVLRRLTDHTLGRADRVFVLSEQALGLIDRRLWEGKVEVLPMSPPPPPPPDVALPPEAHGGPFLVVVGDLARYKGVELVLDALARLPPSERLSTLVVGRPVEPRYARALARQVDRAGLRAHVRLLGALDHARTLALMRASRGCVVPSRFENPSRVPVEAMSVGVPLVLSDIPPFRAIADGAALFFDLDAPERLAGHLRQLARDDALARELARAGAARLRDLDTGSATRRILTALESLAA
jgi:glycosyltransferase involved in cell wall biosynthesis